MCGRLVLCAIMSCVGAAGAHAAPAEVVILLDTSASMNDPLSTDGPTKLALAKDLATDIADTLGTNGHRVGLFRFRQLTTRVMTGEGERDVVVEDEMQCERGADLIVPVSTDGPGEVARWTNGVASPTDPELQALGDSPLFTATRLVLGFIRARRKAAPATSCVNALVVVITDGADTCAAGSELTNALGELRDQSVDEDIRGFVIAADPTTEAATLLARLGHEADASARAYGFDEATALLDVLDDVEGRLAPEACVISGVEPEEVGLPPEGSGNGNDNGGSGSQTKTSGDDGCAAGAPSGGHWLFAAFALLLCLRRRRARVVVGAALAMVVGACGDDGAGVSTTDTFGGDVPTTETQLLDPSTEASAALARLDTLLDVIPGVRDDVLKPILDPQTAYAAITGDKVEGCLALARSIAFAPTWSAWTGPKGCLVDRRCNALDHALLAQACMDHHGVTAAIHRCRPQEDFTATLLDKAAEPAPDPDISAALARLRAAADAALDDDPGLKASLQAAEPVLDRWFEEELDDRTAETIAKLAPLVDVDAEDSATFADETLAGGLDEYFYVMVDDVAYDAVLATSPAGTATCTGAAIEPEGRSVEVTVKLLAQYAEISEFSFGLQTTTEVGAFTWRSYEVPYGERLAIAITDAGQATIGEGIPPAATSGCLHGLFAIGDETAATDPFFVLGEEAGDCPATPATDGEPGLALVRVILRTEVKRGSGVAALERVLVDRYGFATSRAAALATGPIYSAATARQLIPMRIDLLVGGGLPTSAQVLDSKLADLLGRRGELRRKITARYGVAPADPTPLPLSLKPYDWHTLGLVRWKLDEHLPAGSFLTFQRPWRMATVRRRGFGEAEGGLTLVDQEIFDIIEFPAVVAQTSEGGASDAERLAANIALGALITEAERIAGIGYGGEAFVINAGAMLREVDTEWAAYQADDAHDPSVYPMAVQDAALNRRRNNEEVIATPGAVELYDQPFIAWWRYDTRSGQTLGEIRYDGTFYGGATSVAKAIATLDYCLAAQAVAALTSPNRVIPDVDCCLELAAKSLAKDLVVDWATNVGIFSIGYFVGGGIQGGLDAVDVYDAINMYVSYVDFATGLLVRPTECQ